VAGSALPLGSTEVSMLSGASVPSTGHIHVVPSSPTIITRSRRVCVHWNHARPDVR